MATATSSHGASSEAAAEARLGGEADGVQGAVDPAPPLAEGVADRLDVGGLGDVELEHVGRRGELAGRALGEATAPGRRR